MGTPPKWLTEARKKAAAAKPTPKVRLVQNWYEEFRDREQD